MSSMQFAGQRFLLSGASGLLGTAIRSTLLNAGADLLQLVRRDPAGPREIRWDPSSERPVDFSSALSGIAAAIHLSGANVSAHRWTPGYRREMWSSRVGSTRGLSEMLVRLPTPPRSLLVASATGIYGDRGDEALDENSAPGSGFLADLCREWEDAARPAAQASMRVVHLRFGVVLAPEGGALAKMLPPFRLGLGGRMGSGRQWMSWMAHEDAVAAVRFLLAHDELSGPVNLCAPQPVTNTEFARALGARLHRPAILPVPAFALRALFGQMADEALLASARVLPKRLMAAGFQFTRPTLDEALATMLG